MSPRDIQKDLLASGADRKQIPAKNVYPMEYSRAMQDFDNWDHLFYVRVLGRMSVHPYEEPPKRVLELGCGTGMWMIDAASGWKQSTFIGFDRLKIQPDLVKSKRYDLARRVQWVHGNFLDPLPFPPDEFDFVRIHNVGLGVPEDKWQDVFEEVYRVLKSGGQLEITEEDQPFPCGPNPPEPPEPTLHPTDSAVSLSSNLATSTPSTEAISPISSTTESVLPERKPGSRDSDCYLQVPRISLNYEMDPRDHRRMAASWKMMLQKRFLSQKPVSILGFYLSSVFEKIEPLPQLVFRLPPNSFLFERPPWEVHGNSSSSSFDWESAISFNAQSNPPPKSTAWKTDPTVFVSHSPLPDSSSALHLARRLSMISGCKEAIWDAYEPLYNCSFSVSQVRGRARNTARDEFEFYWSNWIDDMTDRVGMRNLLTAALAWLPPPVGDSPPSSTVWRDRCGKLYADDVSEDCDPEETNVTRILRCFLAWKV